MAFPLMMCKRINSIYREEGMDRAEMILGKISRLPIQFIDTIEYNVFSPRFRWFL